MVLLAGAFSFVVANISEGISGSSLNKGLVGHWTMDQKDYNSNTNRLTDKSAYSTHGANYGATFTVDRYGRENSAMDFDGSDYLTISDSKVVSDVSVSVWVKSDDDFYQGVWQIVSDYSRFILGTGNADSRYMCFIVNPDGEGWQYGTCYTVPSGDPYGWHHFVGTRDGSTGEIKIYYDGELKNTKSKAPGNLPSSDRDMTIAKREASASYFDGAIDDLRIYNRVLSPDEVKLLYDSYKPAGGASAGDLKKGLILDMPLSLKYTKNETPGSEIMTDRTPYSNDGQNHGATIARGDNYIYFDGEDDYIDLGNAASLNPLDNEFSISVWAKADSTMDSTGMIVSKGNSGSSGYGIWLSSGNIPSADYSDGTTRAVVSSGSGYNDNIWHHYVAVHKSDGKTYLYIDGDYKAVSSNSATNSISSSHNFYIGQNYAGGERFKGNIRNLKVYNRALSPEEISLLYDKEKPFNVSNIITRGLVLYLDTGNMYSLPSGSDDSSTFYNLARGGDCTFYTESTMVNSSKRNRDEWVYFDGSGEYDGSPAGNHIVIGDETLTRTDQSSDGWTYFWVMKLTGSQPHGQRIFHGAATIRHIEIKNEGTSSPYFRTEAARDNGYSFGTGTIPGGSLLNKWNTFAIVWDNEASPRTVKWYKNGELFYTDTNFDDGDAGTAEYFSFNRIGRSGGTSDYKYTESLKGYLPVFMSYNRKLSPEEILANHNAFKARFGIE